MSAQRLDLDKIKIAAQSAVSRDLLHDVDVDIVFDAMADRVNFQFAKYVAGKRLPLVTNTARDRVVFQVPRSWWGWRRLSKGKPVRRWRDAAIDVTVRASSVPVLMFPEVPVKFDQLGPIAYQWDPAETGVYGRAMRDETP